MRALMSVAAMALVIIASVLAFAAPSEAAQIFWWKKDIVYIGEQIYKGDDETFEGAHQKCETAASSNSLP